MTEIELSILGRVKLVLLGKPENWALADADEARFERIVRIAQISLVRTLYAPVPSKFNGRIIEAEALTTKVFERNGVSIMRGVNADGVVIPVGDAFYIASADCPTIVAVDPATGLTIAAHAGRDSLVDRERIRQRAGWKRSRPNESVVDAIVERFRRDRCDLAAMKVFVTCGIGPEHFGHDWLDSQHGVENMMMCSDILMRYGRQCFAGEPNAGKLVLAQIIREQFMAHGVRLHNIGTDAIDTHGDRNHDGDHSWWSYARGDGDARNGVLVKRLY